jgi:ferredoxin
VNRRAARLRLAWASLRQAASPLPPVDADEVTSTYGAGGLGALTPRERSRLPAMSRCIGCGLCALVIRRAGYTRLPDLPNAYLRDAGLLPAAAPDLRGGDPGADALAAAASVCPVGVPLDEVAVVIRKMADAGHDDTAAPGV